MSLLAILTFDLNDADSEDYDRVDGKLSKLGFQRHLTGSDGSQLELPYNTYAGQFTGADSSSVRDSLRNSAKQVFSTCGVHGRQFVVVCSGYACGTGTF